MRDQDGATAPSRDKRGRAKALAAAVGLVAIVGFLSPIGISPCCLRGVRAALKSELRNVVSAQEGFYADSHRYSATLPPLALRPTRTVQLTIERITPRGFEARARYVGVDYAAPAGACGVWGGDSSLALDSLREWEPYCWIPRRPLWRFGSYRSTEPR